MSEEQPVRIIRYDLDIDKIMDRDIYVTVGNIIDLLSYTLGTMMLPDEESEKGFLESPMSNFYTKKDDVKIEA